MDDPVWLEMRERLRGAIPPGGRGRAAATIGVSESYLTMLLAGSRGNPSASVRNAVRSYLERHDVVSEKPKDYHTLPSPLAGTALRLAQISGLLVNIQDDEKALDEVLAIVREIVTRRWSGGVPQK